MTYDYLEKLISYKDKDIVKIITGIRRCGKSYLLFDIYYNYLVESGVNKDHIIAINLESRKNIKLRDPDKLYEYVNNQIIDEDKYYIFIDEIQMVNEVEDVVNGIKTDFNSDLYITGSNSKFLSSDIMTEFRGRGDEVRVFPLSFAEFYSSNQFVDKYEAWNEYSRYGGLPMLLTKKTDDEKIKYLKDLLTKTYIQDVIERNHLKGDVVIGTLVDILASSIGSLTNPTKLANTFTSNNIKTTDKTISTYIEYLTDAFMISKVQRYDIKGKKYINSPFKFYFTDIGIRNCRLNYRQQEQTHIMENIIYNELLIRGYNIDVGIIEHMTRNKNGKQQLVQLEVDFICNKGSNRYYIQSAFSIPDETKMIQETSSLDKIDDSFKKIIVTQDLGKPWRNDKGYLIINILDFLLNPNSLDL